MCSQIVRCHWATDDPLYCEYHDREWGVPLYDDRALFEFLVLEGMQAGLSWITVLRKRERYREVFDGFQVAAVAAYGEEKLADLLIDKGIIRNRLKIRAAVTNAQAFVRVQQEFGSFGAYLWPYVGGAPQINHWQSRKEVPASTPESDALSRDLKKRGFAFVGTTICYAFMQATGMVMDHTTDCFRHQELCG